MVLRSGFVLIAQKLQEAADSMPHSNVRSMLADAVHDAHRGTNSWASYIDHTGDGETGDCIYNCSGDTMSAPYEISTVGDKHAANLDTKSAKKVVPVTSYMETADDDDHYTSMQESLKTAGIYTELPLYERFISKGERDAAGEEDFAGKGKSFPILKPADVGAAVHAMGRAGTGNLGMSALKARIIAIAKRKGWTAELPKAWRGTDATESQRNVSRETPLKLVESMPWAEELLLSESVASGIEREIRIIVPCKGSSAVYTEAALKKSVGAFKAGTQMFINHATRAEEAARPEGDWRKLVGQLTSDARWNESHKSGPALYAKARFVSSMAPEILEKASMSGVSIRANGTQATEAGRPLVKDGLPVLDQITSVESIDIVTKAGAGGVILEESARTQEGTDMTLQEATTMVNEAVSKAVAPLKLNETRREAREEGARILEAVTLPPVAKTRIIERAVSTLTEGAAFDASKFREVIVAEAQAEGQYLATVTGSGRVVGMGGAPFASTELTEAEEKAERKRLKRVQESGERLREASLNVFSDLMDGNTEAAHAAAGVNRKVAA